MANWTLTGELGSGKSITAVGKFRDFLMAGRRVASNMDVYLEKLMPPMSRATYVRVPDYVTAEDLWDLGLACPERDESKFGGLFLDELGVILNSREWQGKARDKLIKYLRHVRKRHWHTFFLTQDIESLDAQCRRALIEHKVSCKRTDRLSIPLLGMIIRLLQLGEGKLPKMHVGIVRYGKDDRSPVVETWKYWGKGLYDAYNTDQVFMEEPFFDRDVPQYSFHFRPMMTPVVTPNGSRLITFEQAGSYTVLSAWHLRGRYLNFFQRHKPTIKLLLIILSCVYFGFFWYDSGEKIRASVNRAAVVQQQEEAKSYFLNGDTLLVTTQDGLILDATGYRIEGDKIYMRAGKKWYVSSLQSQ